MRARCTMACTWPEVSVVPGFRSTRIEAVVAGWLPMAKSLCCGHDQVDLSRLDPLDGLDCLLQLPLEGLLVLDLLDELRGGDAALLQVGEADGSRVGQALFGQGYPLLVDVGGRHQDGGSSVAQLVGDLGGA